MVGAARVEGMVEELFEVWSAGGPSKDLAVIAKTWLLLDEAGQSDVRRWLLHASKVRVSALGSPCSLCWKAHLPRVCSPCCSPWCVSPRRRRPRSTPSSPSWWRM